MDTVAGNPPDGGPQSKYNIHLEAALAPHLPEVLPEALVTTRIIEHEELRTEALAVLTPKFASMPVETLLPLWAETLPVLAARGYVGKFYNRRRTGHKIAAEVEGNHGTYTVSIDAGGEPIERLRLLHRRPRGLPPRPRPGPNLSRHARFIRRPRNPLPVRAELKKWSPIVKARMRRPMVLRSGSVVLTYDGTVGFVLERRGKRAE